MSWQAVAAARRHRVGHPAWKAVLLVIADAAHTDGTNCYMKYATIAEDAECSLPTVKRAVPAMIAAGILKGHPGDLAVEMNDVIVLRAGVTTTPRRHHPDTKGDQAPPRPAGSPRHRPVSPRDSEGVTTTPLYEPVKNRSTTDSCFDEFWTVYPLRKSKGQARTAWAKAVKKEQPEAIIAAAARYRDDPSRKPNYTAHAATWLNGERWLDEVDTDDGSYIDADGNRRTC